MIDSRVDFVESLVKDAMVCTDRDAQLELIKQAIRDWADVADEFPVTDSLVAVVTTRLEVARRHLFLGEWGQASVSMQMAAQAVRAMKKR